MKKLFNHTKRPYEKWEEYDEENYDWDDVEEIEESEYDASADEEGAYYADGEYEAEEAEETYYAEESEEEYYAEENGEEYYEEEEYYAEEEDEYYPEEDAYYEEERPAAVARKANKTAKKSGFAALWAKFQHMDAMDRIMMGTGVAVLVLALITGSVYASARILDKQVSGFVSVGTQLKDINLIGEHGLIAVADAHVARIAAVNAIEDEMSSDYDETDYNQPVTVGLDLVSVQKDLKIKFTNQRNDKLVSNVPFVVTVEDPSGNTENWSDDDMDGIIYKKGIEPGRYQVTVNDITDSKYERYTLPLISEIVEVKKDIEYTKINVKNEIKAESEINAAKEDTKKNETVVESKLEDTVKWVESTTIATTYVEVAKSTIADPLTLVSSGAFMRMAEVTGLADMTKTVGDKFDVEAKLTFAEGESLVSGSESWSVSSLDGKGAVTMTTNGSKASFVAEKAGKVEVTYTAKIAKTVAATPTPTPTPTVTPTPTPTVEPTPTPTVEPTPTPTVEPTPTPTVEPTPTPTVEPTPTPTAEPAPEPPAEGGGDESVTPPENTESQGGGEAPALLKAPAFASIFSMTRSANNTVTKEEVITKKFVIEVKDVTGKVTVDKTTLKIAKGQKPTIQAKAEGFGEGKTVTYSAVSKNAAFVKVVSVDASSGKVTIEGVEKGSTEVIVTATCGTASATATIKVEVTDALAISLSHTALTVYTGSPQKIVATIANPATSTAVTAETSDASVATVAVSDKEITITGVKAGSATITVKYKENDVEVKATCAVTVKTHPKDDRNTRLKNTSGTQLYVLDGNNYREATYADYYTASKFFVRGEAKYTGWQTLNGKVYFFDSSYKKVTGEQVIQGARYTFASDGSLMTGSGTMGIDVSKWNGTIDWKAVKNSGVSYVIIRSGYRGSSQGSLIEDPKFVSNIKGASAAGLKVGIYFFTQAVDEVEAVEEASMVLEQVKGYKISYPIFLDVESSGGRADGIDKETRTAVVKAFCKTIEDAGYTAGVYANKTWLTNKMDASALSAYKIWLAQYAKEPTYTGKYDLWQYSSTGKVTGISGNVDLNLSYLGY